MLKSYRLKEKSDPALSIALRGGGGGTTEDICREFSKYGIAATVSM